MNLFFGSVKRYYFPVVLKRLWKVERKFSLYCEIPATFKTQKRIKNALRLWWCGFLPYNRNSKGTKETQRSRSSVKTKFSAKIKLMFNYTVDFCCWYAFGFFWFAITLWRGFLYPNFNTKFPKTLHCFSNWLLSLLLIHAGHFVHPYAKLTPIKGRTRYVKISAVFMPIMINVTNCWNFELAILST